MYVVTCLHNNILNDIWWHPLETCISYWMRLTFLCSFHTFANMHFVHVTCMHMTLLEYLCQLYEYDAGLQPARRIGK